MSNVKTATFNNVQYDILIGEYDGYVDTDDKYSLVIQRDLKTRAGLETAIHESLHACRWSAQEETVTQTAKDITRFLWRLGYRRTKK